MKVRLWTFSRPLPHHVFGLLIALFLLCVAVSANALEQVTLQLKWIHQFQFAGYYAAKQQGYYRDAGLDVTILPAIPGKDPVLEVIDGKAQYGVGTSSLLLLRNAGKPVVALAVIFQHSPYILLTKEHSASQTIHNLAGKRLMLEPQADELLAYLKKEGIPIEKMQIVKHSFNSKDLIDGKVDVISGYVTNDPYDLQKAGFAYHAYTPRSAGIDFYGDNLFTTENELATHPDRARAFREASLKGWQYALQHPDEMIDHIISTYSPQFTRADLTYEAEQIKQLMRPDLVEIGYMHAGRWRHIADTYTGLGMLPEDMDLHKFMFDPHPDKDMATIYRIIAILFGFALPIIAVRLIKTSRSLKISEEKFYNAFEHAPVMKAISDMDSGALLNVNAKFCEVTGFSKDDVIGKNSIEIGLLTPKDRKKITDAIDLNGRFSDIELKLHTATGAMLDSVFFGELVKVGKTKQLLTIGLDVTEHRRAQLSLTESNDNLLGLIRNIPGYVAYVNSSNLCYEFVNDKFLESFGAHRERVIGCHVKEIIGESNFIYALPYIDRVRSGESVCYENSFDLASGKRWIQVRYNPIFNRNGDVTSFVALSFDITERKQADEKLRKLSLAIEQTPITIVITDCNGNIEFVNPKFTQLTGYTAEEAIGQNPRLLKSGQTPPAVHQKLWSTISSGNVWEGEFTNKRKDGTLFCEHATISPIRDNKGTVTHYLAIKEDITEKKSVMEQLIQSQKVESIGQLAGGLAHDFNNILSVISGFAYLMKLEMGKDSKQLPNIERILSATAKAAELTQGLLAYSRKQVMNPVNQNLNVLITNVGSFIARLIGEHIKFSVTTQGAPLPVFVDSLQIEQVLMNLATNARDAMPNGGTFSITSSAGSIDEKYISSLGFGEIGHYAIITVADTGCGMSADTAQRIFDPFYTTKESGKGTGLGMAMVMGIIKQHKGFIDVNSEVGAGTAFTIYLPLVGADLPEISKESDLQIEPGVGTILVAEDDSEVQEYMKRLLTKYGYKVILAVDGQDAVDKYAEHKDEIDLLLFDMVMPKKSGKVTCDEIKQMGGTIECLFVSGYAGDFIERQGELGANTILLSKPIQPKMLLSKIADILPKQFLNRSILPQAPENQLSS